MLFVAVFLIFVLAVMVCGFPITRAMSRPIQSKLIFLAALVVGFWIRIYFAQLGHNQDMPTFIKIAQIVDSGESIYIPDIPADRDRTVWGPVWPYTLKWILRVSERVGSSHPETFHVLQTSVLSVVDVCIATILFLVYGTGAGVFFMLAPLAFLITGYHAQFDNTAVLGAMISWWVLALAPYRRVPRVIVSGVMLGLSLATKHLMLFFPIWVLFRKDFCWREKLSYGAIAYLVFAGSFLPWIFDPGARAGIIRDVLQYSSHLGYALIPRLIRLLGVLPGIGAEMDAFSWSSGVKFISLILLLVAGIPASRCRRDYFVLTYLLALLILTPAVADQYLAIPLAACAVLWKNPVSWIYVAVATASVIANGFNIGELPQFEGLRAFVWNLGFLKSWYLAQLLLALLFVQCCILNRSRRIGTSCVKPVEEIDSAPDGKDA